MPSKSDKLIARLRANGLIARDEPAGIRYLGQKQHGWRWRVTGKNGRDLDIGSRLPIGTVAMSADWVITQEDEGIHIGIRGR